MEGKLVNLRTFAILCVVMSHSIILYSESWHVYETIYNVPILNTLKKLIGYYQMPLFFSLSGYLFYYTCLKNRSVGVFIKDKFMRLIIPFLCITILWLTPIKMLLDVPGFNSLSYFELLLKNIICLKSTGHLWFCISLFIIFIIYYILNRLFNLTKKDKFHYFIDISILILSGICLMKMSFFKALFSSTAFHRVFQYLFWFYFGFCINKYAALGKNEDSHKLFFVPYLALLTGALIIIRLDYSNAFIKILTPICIVLTAYLIVPYKTNKFTEYINRNSMGMFLFHSVLIYISYTLYPNINPILMTFINFILFGSISSLMTELIRKTRLKFIIGEKK